MDPLTVPQLHPYALTTYDRALSYLGKPEVADVELWVTTLINAVTDRLEGNTGRRLRVRNYRNPVTVSGTTVQDSPTVTISPTSIKEFDQVSGAGIQDGTLVYDVGSTTITLSKPATAAATVPLTFGSAPIRLDWRAERTPDGWWRLATGNAPLNAVYSIKWADYAGVLTALDLTIMRLKPLAGVIVLPTVAPPSYSCWIEVECSAGFMPPKPGTIRGFDGWADIELLALRCIQIVWQDKKDAIGRGGHQAPMGMMALVQDFSWPGDIQDQINSLRAPWL